MDRENAAGLRRSPRILALEQKTSTGQTSTNVAPSIATKKRGRKRNNRLEEDDESEDEHEFFQQGNSQSGGGHHGVDRRMTYQPPASASASKGDQDDDDEIKFSFDPNALRKLVQTPFPPGAYGDSLNRFSKDLGPVAQRIAQSKLAELEAIRASERTEAPESAQGPRIPMLAGSRPATLFPQLSQNFVMGHGQWGHPFSGRMPESSHGRTSSEFSNGMTFTSARSDSQWDRLFPAQPSVHMTRFNWAANEQVHQNISNFSASNKGKAVSSDDSRSSFNFFSNATSNAGSGLSTGIEGRFASPDERFYAQGKTSHLDEKNVDEFLSILGGNNGSETTLASQGPLDSDFASASSISGSQLMPTPMLSSLLASPSRGMWWLPLQTNSQMDQAARTYLDELRSGRFNAIASSEAALRYTCGRSTRSVGFGEPAPMAPIPMLHSPGRQMQANDHDPSAVQTELQLRQPLVAPSKQGPPLDLAGPSGGAASRDCQDQTTAGWSSRNNGDKMSRDFDLNL